MSNTKEGGQTLRETMIARYGSEEKWKEWMRTIAKEGGKNGHTGGFYNNSELAARTGRISRKRAFNAEASDGVISLTKDTIC